MEFNGMYKNQRTWGILTKTAKKGDNVIQVSGDVSAWPVGGRVAIASTDYNFRQAEDRKITFTKKGMTSEKCRFVAFFDNLHHLYFFFRHHHPIAVGPNTLIGLEYGLFYSHWGQSIYTGVPGQWLSEAAEVALLDRSIVIKGSQEKDPYFGASPSHYI